MNKKVTNQFSTWNILILYWQSLIADVRAADLPEVNGDRESENIKSKN
jgi:hypothetical protein